MELKHKLEKLFNNDYPGTDRFIADVIVPIFGNEIEYINDDLAEREKYAEKAKNAGIKHIKYVGDLTEKNYNADNIALLDVTLDDSKNIERSRVNIQQLIRSIMDYRQHLMIVFHYEDVTNKQWRFSYAYKGDSLKDSTSAKRYTYVFGKDYRGRTAAERFQILADSPRSNEDFENAFSVAALSDEFFKAYRAYYAAFVEYITGDRYSDEKDLVAQLKKFEWLEKDSKNQFEVVFESQAKEARDYIKKMFGRIVFLYFLQRKGWLYDNNGESDPQYMKHLFEKAERDGLAETFLDDVLELLFFYVLNTDRAEERKNEAYRERGKDITILPGWNKIPFLNGGLFEQDYIDPKICTFPPEYFHKLFEFLDSYNFTIDENDTNDFEVGIDPEMLGRIFENLLEDNKDKGAFYTPKEIVDYMCRESIIAYIQNDVQTTEDKELIRKFIETLDIDLLNNNQRDEIENKLLKVKICDPSIGSGAFPMGLVNLLSKIFIVLRTYSSIDHAKMKRYIMQQSIYGVDIEKGAVDIARLRFWLAMVVDEETAIPLPNLHFKIMQGNSLLECYKGKDLSQLTQVNIGGDGSLGLENDEAKFLISSLGKFYNESDHNKRKIILDDIIKNVRRQIFDITQSEDFMEDIKDLSANDKFFLWHTWFADVFENGGFDIVIGNPPYIQLQKSLGITAIDKKGKEYDMKLGDLYKDANFATFEKTGDIYCLFYELGNKMLKDGGHLCYITSNKWMRAGYGESLRSYLSKDTNPKILIDFGGIQIFDSATVDTNILLIEKAENLKSTIAVTASKHDKTILNNLSDFVQQNASLTDFNTGDSWVVLTPIELSIKHKIESVGVPLKDWDIQINYGIKTGFNDAFIINKETRKQILANCKDDDERERTDELIRPILRGRDIKCYGYEWAGLWLINTHNGIKGKLDRIHIEDYPAVKIHLDQYWDKISTRADKGDTPYNLRNCAYLDDFKLPKLIYPETTQGAYFAFDDGGIFLDKTCFMLITKYPLYLQSILSSKLYEFAYKRIFSSIELGTSAYQYNKHALVKLPIAPVSNDITMNDSDIYELYNISNAEIRIIESI
ncbi:MAG: Eco57I restriction-modification methylase domain-containing protein [Muribaculaceae bacterium]|nr:Eco57I restriction-modification methylase domain-containing protein [Muribaculaceae bacterium]